MATAILSSGSSLNHRFDHETLIHRNHSRLRCHSHASTTAPRRLKRSPTTTTYQSRKMVVSPAVKPNLVMGQVKILKRGETLSAFRNGVVTSTNKIGPEPETSQKQIGEIVSRRYAGACSSASPPPSSLPIPCFLGITCLARFRKP
ncbi:unnamed protein product [Brassica oleracea var. botrytis]|uniref:Uncharacterized protein n=2 Tax=Brassica oleracea TaxID=3712 RepID=A0A0D3B8W5_BRAOL|nr:PREDICTED: uncharacterized protein LOC106328609 [Brassica oleracea var. oleracea]VDC91959.1 unnamed protein product [Brassica oleracea]